MNLLWRSCSALALAVVSLPAAGFRAGVSKVDITPQGPIWLSGYANRNKPSEGVAHPLAAKALALEDGRKNRTLIITFDLIGLPRSLSELMAARLQKEYGLERSQILFNCSHTHTGPVVRPNLITMFDLPPAEVQKLDDYAQMLVEKVVALAGDALRTLQPADVSFAQGSVSFAVNRRQFTPKGVRIGVNPSGPVDHSVPVLRVSSNGRTLAVLFGYACHNTTLTGEHYQISGDYAGFAQAAIEQELPGATALFLMLCGGDQNPHPRGTVELASQHGATLAREVLRLLGAAMEPVRGPLRTAYTVIELPLAPYDRHDMEKLRQSSIRAQRAVAEATLKALEERHAPRSLPYPIQRIHLDRRHTLLALGGEVVVEYGLRTKSLYPKRKLIVAGYSNDVMCYIPTKRILEEGGYEAVDSMYYYGWPAPFSPEVEDRIVAAIQRLMK
jgi:hypothetical protein